MNLYDDWADSLFNRDESKGDWRWEIDSEPVILDDVNSADFFIRLMGELPALAERFSLWQITLGIEYLFNNSMSDFMYTIRDGEISTSKRVEAILSIKALYLMFSLHCEPKLGHLSEEGGILNGFCYMLWDTTPLSYGEESKDKKEIYRAIVYVLQFSLERENVACIESALHGFGHLTPYSELAVKAIQGYIDRDRFQRGELLSYANDALTHSIQ